MNIKEQLERISATEENKNALYDIFRNIDENSIPIIRYLLPAGTNFFRQRVNRAGEDFNKISELSYPPAEFVLEYGRVNIPYNPMFYCSTFNANIDSNTIYPRLTTLLETSLFARGKLTSGIERTTCSKWIAKVDLNLIALPFSPSYKRPNRDISIIQQEWNRIARYYNGDKRGLELVEYMSDEIAKDYKNSIDYFKIAHFIYYLMWENPKTRDADGILYPSVQTGGEGFNIALKPKSADNNLMFDGASLCYLAKKREKMYLKIINYSDNDNGYIRYFKRDINHEEEVIYSQYSEGLEFIN